jgi:hypothetical protein
MIYVVYNNLYRFMYRLILHLYKSLIMFNITYIEVFLKLIYTVVLN